MTLKKNLLSINQKINAHAERFAHPYFVFAIFGIITYPLYFGIWKLSGSVGYDHLGLRLITVVLCLLLSIKDYWPKPLKPFLAVYWYFTLLYSLPFLFTFLLLQNNFSYPSAMNTMTILVLMILLLDFVALTIILLLGVIFAVLLFVMTGGHFNLPDYYPDILITYASILFFGTMFSYSQDQLKEAEKKMKIIEESNKIKSEFIANMGHDIRTPLTGIIGLSSILEDEVTEKQQKEHAHMLTISGEQLLFLLNSIMDMVARGTSQDKQLHINEFDLEEMLCNLVELERPAIQVKFIRFDLKMDANIPKIIKSDKSKIYRVLLNLISNAIKFTREGSITLSAKLLKRKRTSGLLQFKVVDTGIGIEEDDQSKIFDVFFKTSASDKENYDGYGVGLSIVKQYIQSLNGTIEVSSKRNVGTTITVSIPVKIVSKHSKKIQRNEKKQQSSNMNSKGNLPMPSQEVKQPFVLLVEDNPIVTRVATQMLQKENCAWFHAPNATDALNAMKHYRFDFVLSDIGLPDFSGVQLAEKIADYEKELGLPSTPIIGLTAQTKETASSQQGHSSMLRILEKPLKIEELHELIQTYCPEGQRSSMKQPAQPEKQPEKQAELNNALLFEYDTVIERLMTKEAVIDAVDFMVNNELQGRLSEIDASYQAQDWAQFKALVHTFNNSCLYCGTSALLHLTNALQDIALDDDLNHKASVYKDFKHCAVNTRQYLNEWLQKNQ